MPQRERKKIDTGIYLIEGRVYFERTKSGRLHRRKASLQYSAALNERGRPTSDLRRAYREFCDAIENEEYRSLKRARSAAPTVERLVEVYRIAAAARFATHGSPRPATTSGNITNLIALARDIDADRLDGLTAEAVGNWVAGRVSGAADADRARVSAWSALAQARSCWARWARTHYESAGIILPECLSGWPAVSAGATSARYERPPEALRAETKVWRDGLEASDPRLWLACALMAQFAMRPIDAANLRWENFERRPDGRIILRYIPSKTRGRTARLREVRWPVGADLLARMRAAGGAEYVLPGASTAERYSIYIREINPAMRGLGWARSRYGKACYELRKLCIDDTYQRFGLSRAIQISGDSSATVQAYYSDPNADALEPVVY
jgi:integrase